MRNVIIGGGLAGLIAAVTLARDGAEVLVLDGAADAGGRARTHERDGYFLNQGAHALYRGGALQAALDDFGLSIPGGFNKGQRMDAMVGRTLKRLPVSLGSLAMSNLFGLKDKIAFAAAQTALARAEPADFSLERSFSDWCDARRLDGRARQAIDALARLSTYANAPEIMPARAVLEQIRLAFAGVRYVDGGWSTIVSALVDAARRAGAEIRTGVHADRIEAADGGIIVRMGDEVLAAASVLLAVSPAAAAALAPGSRVLQSAAREAVPARANTLDLALSRLPQGASTFTLGIDEPFYHSVHSGAARLAPGEGAVVHLAKYLEPGAETFGNPVQELEAFADITMPGWRALEVHRSKLVGMPVSYGVPRAVRSTSRAGRPDVDVADLPGVYVAGDWVGARGFISDAAAASAREAAALMLARSASQRLAAA